MLLDSRTPSGRGGFFVDGGKGKPLDSETCQKRMSTTVYIGEQKAGHLWKSKASSSIAVDSYVSDAGLHPLLSVVDAKSSDSKDISRAAKFACVAFRSEESISSVIDDESAPSEPNVAVIDQRGYIYVMDMDNDRTGIAGTAIALGTFRPWELIVGLSDRSLQCYNVETLKPMAKLSQHHKTAIQHISVHPIEPRVLTTSETEAILWDSDEWTKIQSLTGPNNVPVNQAGFSPTTGDALIATFDDNSMVIWDTQSLMQLWRIDSTSTVTGTVPMGLKCWAVSKDNGIIATGGWSAVQIWDLNGRYILRELTDPLIHEGVASLAFLGVTRMLIVMNVNGDLLFVDSDTGFCKFIANVLPAKSFSVSPDGKFLAVHSLSVPSVITVWSVQELLTCEYTRPISKSERSPSAMGRRSGSFGRTSGRGGVSRRTMSGNFSRSPERVMGAMRRDAPSTGQSSQRRSYHDGTSSGSRLEDAKRRSMTFNNPPKQSPTASPQALTPRHRRRQSLLQEPASPTTANVPSSGRSSTGGGQLLEDRRRTQTMYTDPRSSSRMSIGSSGISALDNSLSSMGSTLTAGPLLANIDLNELKEAEVSKIYESLEKFIRKRGGFPDEYRSSIWRFLLKLPNNQAGYRALIAHGEHPCIADMRRRFQMKDKKLQAVMEQTMSALAHWSLKFTDLTYHPFLAFPFVKMFQDDLVTCFEVLATIFGMPALSTLCSFVNWCQDWWTEYPSPPVQTLSAIEELLHQHDPELFQHFQSFDVTVHVYGWIPLQSFFSDCLPRQHWARLWDHSFSRQPRFLYHFSVAFLISVRGDLFMLDRAEDFHAFFRRPRQDLDMKRALKLASRLSTASYGSEADVFASFRPFRPIPRPGDEDAIALGMITGEYPPLEVLVARQEDDTGETHPGSFGEVDDLMQQRLAAMRFE